MSNVDGEERGTLFCCDCGLPFVKGGTDHRVCYDGLLESGAVESYLDFIQRCEMYTVEIEEPQEQTEGEASDVDSGEEVARTQS